MPLPDVVLGALTDTLTVSMWLKPTRSTRDATWQPLLVIKDQPDWKSHLRFDIRWGRFIVKAGNEGVLDTKESLERDWWSHVVLVRDPAGAEVFVNGESRGRLEIKSLPARFTGEVLLGSGTWEGLMSDVRIYGRRLSGEQIAAIIKAETPPDLPGENDPAPNIAGETLGQVKKRSRYTIEDLKESFPPIDRWAELGVELAPDRLAASYARDRFRAPPPPGVHPRIYFNPEDVPVIRQRLESSRIAKAQWELLRGRLLQISPRREDWEEVPYSEQEIEAKRPAYLTQGRRVNRRMGFHGPWVGGWVNDLAAGKDPEDLSGQWHLNAFHSRRQYLMHLLPFEAFRCLIEEDEAGGRRVAAALTTICRLFSEHEEQWTKTDNWQSIYQTLSSDAIGLTYDWAYNFMTDEQRKEVRGFIATITRGKQFLGLDQVPAFPGNTSNWIIIHMNLLPLVLSIEGEEGYDSLVYERCLEGMRKWVYVASGPDGAPFEGLNKSTYAPQWLLPLAKRGADFIGSEWSKNHVRRFQLGVMLPWGRDFVYETGIDGPRDMTAFKYAHPHDPVVDLIYAGTVLPLLNPDDQPIWTNIRTTYAPWWPQIVINDDPLGCDAAGYDFDARFDTVMASLREQSEPLTYYSDYRGLMTTRTGWGRDEVFLYFEPRNVPGGHTRDSRNEFVFAAHGRLWATRTTAVEDSSELHSVMLIDGKGQGHQCPQGKTVAIVDEPLATFCVGDARWAYSFAAGSDDDAPVNVTPNDSRLEPSPLPWMDRPWNFLPAWNTGMKGGDRHGHWREHNPVEYAYRTAGLVRGKHPYALIIDDDRKDDQEHLYQWLMQVPEDVQIVSRSVGTPGQDKVLDLMLGEQDGTRRLLLRVLAAGCEPNEAKLVQTESKLESYEYVFRNNVITYQRVSLPLKSVCGYFMILLCPHRESESLPTTVWTQDSTELELAWPDQTDAYRLLPGDDGRTRLKLKREDAGELIVN